MKNKILIVLVIILFLIRSPALGEGSVMRVFFGHHEPSELAKTLPVRIDQSVRNDGIILTINDCMARGNSVYISYTVSSERGEPVLYTLSSVTSIYPDDELTDTGARAYLLGGQAGDVIFSDERSEILKPEFWGAPGKPFELSMAVYAARPLWPLELLTDQEWEGGNRLPIMADGTLWAYAIIDGEPYAPTMIRMEELGCVERITELSLTATIDLSKQKVETVHAYLPEAQSFAMDGYIARVQSVHLSTLHTFVALNILPDSRFEESGLFLDEYIAKYDKDYALLNIEGRDITRGRATLITGVETQMEAKASDSWSYPNDAHLFVPYYEKGFTYSLNSSITAIDEVPETLILAPIIEGEEGLLYDMDNAIRLELALTSPDRPDEEVPFYVYSGEGYFHAYPQCVNYREEPGRRITAEELTRFRPCQLCAEGYE